MSSLFKSRRMGRIRISIKLINEKPDIIKEIFLHCIPIQATHNFTTGEITYECLGDVFEEVDITMAIPDYEIIFHSPSNRMEFTKR